MVVLPEVGDSPLPRVNSRFGHPTPQNGLEIQRKWKRADYQMPGSQPTIFHATKKSANGGLKPEA
jgi:formate dehydrogenase major subunit